MTTLTFEAYQVTQIGTYDPEFDFYDDYVTTAIARRNVEVVLGGQHSGFSYFLDENEEISGYNTLSGGDLESYTVRVGNDIADAGGFLAIPSRISWGSDKSTDFLILGFSGEAGTYTEGSTVEESYTMIRLGGDPFGWNSVADFDAFQDSAEEFDDEGNEISFEITDGIFQPDQAISFTDIADYVGSSENDTVNAVNSFYNEYDLGVGNDTFFGTDSDERVKSGKGSDVINLGAGNDYVRVGGGKEEFYGGDGNDYISYYDSSNGVKVNLATNTASGSWAVNDIVEDFESISGSKTGGDSITGTSGANTIRTYGGNDRVAAGGGTDKVELGSGNDYVRVGGGKETFDGGSGTDYISYYSSKNGIRIDLRDDEVSGSWAVNDTIKNFESASGSKNGHDVMLGTNGANTLKSYGGDDKLYGRGGSDKLYGGKGEDFLDGGGGSGVDQLWGGAGADTFEFDRGEGVDVIKDFEDDIDTINLDNFNFGTANAFDFAAQVNGDVVFDFGSDGMLTVENTTIGMLQDDLAIV